METKDFTEKFSLQDLFAYLFPGVAGMFAIYLMLKQLGLRAEIFDEHSFNMINYFICSYVLGVIISGISHPLVSMYYSITKKKSPETEFPENVDRNNVNYIFKEKLGVDIENKKWSSDFFYIARGAVVELMPSSANVINRQGALRLMRQYLIIPLLFWASYLIIITSKICQPLCIKFSVIGLIMLFTLFLMKNLLDRMDKNRKREVYYTIFGLLVLDKQFFRN